MRKCFKTLLAALCLPMLAMAANDVDLKPNRTSNLRLPAVPILTNDPYFSIWSPYNELTEGSVVHWTDVSKTLIGAIRVDGQTYRFLGQDRLALNSLLPMADEGGWDARYVRTAPAEGWTTTTFDDTSWASGKASFGAAGVSAVNTPWMEENSDIYVRRTFQIDELPQSDLYLGYANDDDFEVYLNGVKLFETPECHQQNTYLKLSGEAVKALRKGENVLAAHCRNNAGGAYLDFGLFVEDTSAIHFNQVARQKSVTVLATSSYYTFVCGPVELDVVFTAPQLIDDLDLLSTPINYLSYQVRSLDKKSHQVQVYVETSPDMAVNTLSQPTIAESFQQNGLSYVKAGTIEQPVCGQIGDQICIDWGYMYLAGLQGEGRSVSLGAANDMKQAFLQNGDLAATQKQVVTRNKRMPAMAYVHNLQAVSTQPKQGYVMLGYDDDYSIEYMHERRMAYWKHDGLVTITQAFERMRTDYATIMERCRALDAMIYDDAFKAGGQQYAEICSGSYRQVMAAHKLFTDRKGNLLWFSKENNSNGCVNTVDLTYPSAPLFLAYNPDLQKGMMTSIFEYSASGRWTKPFAAHDLGTYPIANGQLYGGDMPVEESGNMLILSAAISKIEGNTNYVKPYWDILTTWADYLVENGLDPTNQLCTDDFAGHWAHNANLSVKAIMGIQAYSEMARMMNMTEVANRYATIAKTMAGKWEQMADDGDHYRLAFDRPDTWSQKYNMVWDKMWHTNLFSSQVMQKEINCYLANQNTYGLPLDCRKEYTKSDWIMWSAAMSPDKATFQQFAAPLYKYINETVSRVPISDWHHTDSGAWVSFRARSVIGGYWMQVLMDKLY